jgi:hypothetical protein
MDESPHKMMTCRKCQKTIVVDDPVKKWGLIKLILDQVVSFVLNYVHCLLQVISFCMLLFNKEFATLDYCCYFMDLLLYIS